MQLQGADAAAEAFSQARELLAGLGASPTIAEIDEVGGEAAAL